jgi:predicted O-methyltransferase YrrM
MPSEHTPYEVDRAVLPFILRDRNLISIGVEVGVCRGFFSEHILKHWPGHLYLVDLWEEHEAYKDAKYDHAFNYKDCIERLKPFEERITILRTASTRAALNFADDSLDFVYLDANHSYEAVRDDLSAWYPKVRRGGILAGDDYGILPEQSIDFGNGDGAYMFGVKRAVDEFAIEHKRNISIDWLAGWAFEASINGCEKQLYKARNWYLVK